MKIFGRKFLKGNALLFASFTAVSLCLILVISAVNVEKINSMSRNSLYTDNRNLFLLHPDAEEVEHVWDNAAEALLERYDDFAVYYSVPDEDIVIRGILVKGVVQEPPMLSGVYFDENSSWSDTPQAVIGKALENDVYETEEGLFYEYMGVPYRVNGIMGTDVDSRLNHMMLLDFKSALKIVGVSGEYYFDAADAATVRDACVTMEESFDYSAGFIMASKAGRENEPLAYRLFSGGYIMKTMYIMTFTGFSLCTILVTFVWLRNRRQLFFAYKISGYDKKCEMADIAMRYYKVAAAGYIAGIVIMGTILPVMDGFGCTWMSLVEAFAITIGLGTVILSGSYFWQLFLERSKT